MHFQRIYNRVLGGFKRKIDQNLYALQELNICFNDFTQFFVPILYYIEQQEE